MISCDQAQFNRSRARRVRRTTPIEIRDKYQYYTQAEMSKLHSAGYERAFSSLEDGVADYVGRLLAFASARA